MSDTATYNPNTALRGADLALIEAELAAIPEDRVLSIRVDVPSTVTTVLGAAPEIEAQRAAIEAKFGARGVEPLDRIVTLARALYMAHGEHLANAGPDLEPLAKELGEVRQSLLLDAKALIKRGLLDKRALGELHGGQAYQDCATDVATLIATFRSNYPRIASHTKVTLADLQRYEALYGQFANELGARRVPGIGSSDSARTRARAYTLLFNAYDRVRKMLTYLRWKQGDVDKIAPSFFAGRTRSESADPLAPPTPSATPVRPGIPGNDPFTPPTT